MLKPIFTATLLLAAAFCKAQSSTNQPKPGKKATPISAAQKKQPSNNTGKKNVSATFNNLKNMNAFKKADWLINTDVYEVNVRQYTPEGTFKAFMTHMPRLKAMGVSTLWFMPITPIAQKNKKGSMGSPYACSDYTSINPEFGTLTDFKDMVKYAHDLGFKVIIDWVANHTGWDHVWTKTHPEYYEKDPATNDFKIASGMDDIIELDFNNPNLRKAMIAAMQYWVKECNIDGFRCDLAFWVELDFWKEARAALEKTKTLFWLAECDAIDHASYFQAFDACYTWTWMHKTEEFYKKDPNPAHLKDLLQRYNDSASGQALRLWFTSNHDENSWNGSEYEKYGDAAAAFAVHSFTWNGIPLIYSGQEKPNAKRLQFFEKDPIDWSGNCEIAPFYKTLLALRKRNKALHAGSDAVQTHWINTGQQQVWAYLRINGNKKVLVLLNMSKDAATVQIEEEKANGNFTDVFTNNPVAITGTHSFSLPAWGYTVLEQ
jgi:alpha-amylase